MKSISNLFILLLALLCVSCDAKQMGTVEMHDTERKVWNSIEEFYYDNADTLSLRDISIVVRYDKGYVADSVAMSIVSISPDSLVVEEPFTLHIPRLSNLRPETQTFVYRRNALLKTPGRYRFRLTPHTAIEGINSVGIAINSSNSEINK